MSNAKDFRSYIQEVVDKVGTDSAVGKYLGFSDGSRVGLWRRGEGRPDELNVLKLARWMGDDPIWALKIAGYDEMAQLLKGTTGPAPIEFSILRPHLVSLQETIRGMMETMERLSSPRKGEK